MRKQFATTIGAILVIIALTILVFFKATFSFVNILDAAFIVGIITFFIGLLIYSNATDVFKTTGFVFRQILSSRFKNQYQNYYAFAQEKKKQKEKTAGFPIMIVGGVIVIIDLILVFTVI
jgi:hypothetical protein